MPDRERTALRVSNSSNSIKWLKADLRGRTAGASVETSSASLGCGVHVRKLAGERLSGLGVITAGEPEGLRSVLRKFEARVGVFCGTELDIRPEVVDEGDETRLGKAGRPHPKVRAG